MMAMPLVKPEMTGLGMRATTGPHRKTPSNTTMIPANSPANHMPWRP